MTIKEQHALAWYVFNYNYRLNAIQHPPLYQFQSKDGMVSKVVPLPEIVAEYNQHLKDKERSRKQAAVWRSEKKPGYDI